MASAVRVGVRLRPCSSTHPICGKTSLYAHQEKHSFGSIGFQRSTRALTSSGASVDIASEVQRNEDEANSNSTQSTHDRSSPKGQPQIDSFGVSNFRNFLQHQEFTSPANSKSFKKKGRQNQRSNKAKEEHGQIGGGGESSSKSPDIIDKQEHNDKGKKVGEIANQTNYNNNYPGKARYRSVDKSKQRHSWPRQQNRRESKSNKTHHMKKMPASSDWVLVSNVPPLSKLSDLSQNLTEIIEYELQKGIIDVDAVESLEKGSDEERTVSGALNEIGATKSLYATEPIANENVPLWNDFSSSMILETRVHLSYRARPTGWFFRLPNRSVVHAVLNHISLAERHNKKHVYSVQKHDRQLRNERRRWKEGLWRGVQAEYGSSEANLQDTQMEEESQDERDSMWGDGLGDEEQEEDNEVCADALDTGDSDEGAEGDNEDPQDDVDRYIQQYLESKPFPIPSPSSPDTTNDESSPYDLLKSGSTILDIQEFKPTSELSDNTQDPSWEQHSFHMSQQLNLSDSVVRVETSNLRTNMHDIQFLFRGYDLESISSEESEDEVASSNTMPSAFGRIPKSLGWNINHKGNVDFLVYGSDRTKGRTIARGNNSGEHAVNRAKWHAFLVRFSCPAEARMAVRDKQGFILKDHELSVAQYPRQL